MWVERERAAVTSARDGDVTWACGTVRSAVLPKTVDGRVAPTEGTRFERVGGTDGTPTVPPKCRLYLRTGCKTFPDDCQFCSHNDRHVCTLLSAQPDAAAVFISPFKSLATSQVGSKAHCWPFRPHYYPVSPVFRYATATSFNIGCGLHQPWPITPVGCLRVCTPSVRR